MRLLLGMMWLLHWLPLPVLGRIGKAVGSLLFFVMGPRREIALTNLRLTMPELTEAQRRDIARRHFQAYSRSVLERSILWWASEQRLRRLIKVETSEGMAPGKVPVAEMTEKPTILLCPHFVCLDVGGASIAMEASASSMYVAQKNKVFDEVLRAGRARFKPVRLFTRQDGIKPILRALKEKLPYFMLPDMDSATRMPNSFLSSACRLHPDRYRAHRRCNRRPGDAGDRHLPAQLRRLPCEVLSGVGELPRARYGRGNAPYE